MFAFCYLPLCFYVVMNEYVPAMDHLLGCSMCHYPSITVFDEQSIAEVLLMSFT